LPLANALLSASQLGAVERRFPLDLVFCPDCALVQITETVAPETLFSEYLYRSSFSDTMLAHAKALVERMIHERGLGVRSRVIEVASNDGYLLQYYKAHGVPVLGIEPAANIGDLGERLAREGRLADVVHAHNVFAHVPDPGDFLAGLRHVLSHDGVAVIEAPYVRDLISNNEFDTIYHEHFSYYSLTAVDRLTRRHGLTVLDVEHLPIHGGSLRYLVGRVGTVDSRVRSLLEEEGSWGVDDVAFYKGFANRVWKLRDELSSLLLRLKAEGCRIAAYGASAKGSTLLNAFGIGAELIEFVVDRSPTKQGRYTPGTHLRVQAPEALLRERPDYVLLLTWNFADEILEQQREYRDAGGRFIVPIPELRIV
jgi:SAM-dependent methyltransferase